MVTALGPTWFLETDVVFDFIFLLTTIIVTLLGFSAYKFLREEKYKLHSTGFFFLSASYLIMLLTNLYILIEYRDIATDIRDALRIVDIAKIGSLLYAMFFLIGLTFLLILYLKINDKTVRWLLFILVVFCIVLNDSLHGIFYTLAAILLLFIIMKLYENYRAKRRKNSLFILLGFIGVFIGEVLLSLLALTPLMYVAAGIVTVIGYLCIIGGLMIK